MDNLSSIGQRALRNGPQSLINENSEPAVYSTIQTVGEGLAQPDPQRSCASPRGGAHARNRAVPAVPPPSGQQRQRLPRQGSRFLHKRHARPYTSDMLVPTQATCRESTHWYFKCVRTNPQPGKAYTKLKTSQRQVIAPCQKESLLRVMPS